MLRKLLGGYQGGFQHNRSTTDHIFHIRHILGKKMGIQGSSPSALYNFQENL